MQQKTLAVSLLLIALSSGCGASSASNNNNNPSTVHLVIWNWTERPIEDVRAHTDESYANASNLVSTPLADQGRFVIPAFHSGYRVTAMRRNVDGGKLIAFTTATGLATPTDGYTLMVFQESFRLLPPNASENDGNVDDGAPSADGASDDGHTNHGDPSLDEAAPRGDGNGDPAPGDS